MGLLSLYAGASRSTAAPDAAAIGGEAVPVAAEWSSLTGSLSAFWQPWVGAGAAVLVMLIATPLVIRGARRWGWVDYPQSDRWHTRPVALLGGIALFASSAAALVLSGAITAFPWPVWLAASLVFGAGLADDLLDVRPETKLVVQVLATVLLLYAGYAFWRGGPFWLSIPLTFFWVIGITNALNLIDGMDGLAAGIAAIAATVLGVVAWMTGQPAVATVAAVVAGAAATFLVFNFRPAHIFMGDCGSMALGFLLAAVAMNVQGRGSPVAATLAPAVVLAVPIFDTAFVTVTRILSGTPVTEGGTDHTMHRLVMLGLSERQTVLFLYAVSLLFGLGALGVYWATAPLFVAFLLLAVVAAVVFGLYLAQAQAYPDASLRVQLADTTLTQGAGAVMRALAGGAGWKSVAGAMADLVVVGAAFVAAYHLRFDARPPGVHADVMMQALPSVVAWKIAVFYVFRLYHGIWRHAGTPEFVRVLGASGIASGGLSAGLLVAFGTDAVSLSVLILDWMLTTGAVTGIRFGFRGLRQYFASHRSTGRRVLIAGTNSGSVLALRYLRQNDVDRTAVGFLDGPTERTGLRLQGLRVLGPPSETGGLLRSHEIDEVILPPDDLSDGDRAVIRAACRRHGIPCRRFSIGLHQAPARHAFESSTGDGASPSPEPPPSKHPDSQSGDGSPYADTGEDTEEVDG
jgi:UDP-GlcNAc:undecaprenyl-phosphate GlcNAc-1-phosphate transferase